jgi:hypothetical protein
MINFKHLKKNSLIYIHLLKRLNLWNALCLSGGYSYVRILGVKMKVILNVTINGFRDFATVCLFLEFQIIDEVKNPLREYDIVRTI